MKLYELKDIIPKEQNVGFNDKDCNDIPFVDKWGNWINGSLKTLDVEILSLQTCGFLLIILNI